MLFEQATKEFTRLNLVLAQSPTRELTNIETRWLSCADEIARTSTHPRNNKVGAVIFQRSKFVASGTNEEKSHPIQAKWNKFSCNLHAEISALISAFANSEFVPHKATIAVSRVRRKDLLCSYPCKYCYPALLHAGIQHIVCRNYNNAPVSIDLR